MREKEKMLAGLPYNSQDEELITLMFTAKALLHEYNALHPTDSGKKDIILSQLLGFFGTNAYLEIPFYCDFGENISIGDNTYINAHGIFLDGNRIDIGKNVMIGPNVQIYSTSHSTIPDERINRSYTGETGDTPFYDCALPINIGDDTWIGGSAIVLPGVTIGEGTTIGAGSVVTRSIPEYCVAAGNPCRVIRKLER